MQGKQNYDKSDPFHIMPEECIMGRQSSSRETEKVCCNWLIEQRSHARKEADEKLGANTVVREQD